MAHAPPNVKRPLVRNIPPVITIAAGFLISAILAWCVGWFIEWLATEWIGVHQQWMHHLSFWTVMMAALFTLFGDGLDNQVDTAHEAVLEVFGQRVSFFTLSEGRHWLFPWLMKALPVYVAIHTNNTVDDPPIEVEAVAKDGVLMRALIVVKYQVDNPYQSLSVHGARAGLLAMTESVVRGVFSSHDSIALEGAALKSAIGELIREQADMHDYEFGLNVMEVFEPEILPPQEILDANAKLRKEQAEAISEKYELDKRRERAHELITDGLSPELAYEVTMTEAGKMSRSSNVQRFEGLVRPVEIFSNALVQVANALKSDTDQKKGDAP